MLNIAFILPNLAQAGPEIVANDIINSLVKIKGNNIHIDLYYFYETDDAPVIEFNVPCYKIAFEDKIPFDKYDLIHAHCFASDKYIYNNRKYIKGIAVTTTHNIVYDEWKYTQGRIKAFLYQYRYVSYLKKMDKIFALTQTMKDYYARFIPATKISVIPNGRNFSAKNVPQEDFEYFKKIRSQFKWIAGAPCWVTFRKGLHQFIQLLPSFPEVAFVIIGEGDAKTELISLAKKLGVGNQCFFMGKKANGSAYFQLFDNYVMSSYSEGVSLALLEAAANGTPTLCSDIPQNRELFNDSEVSFFKLDDESSIFQAFQTLRDNAKMLAQNMKIKYEKKYTAEVMAQSYLDAYTELLSDKKSH